MSTSTKEKGSDPLEDKTDTENLQDSWVELNPLDGTGSIHRVSSGHDKESMEKLLLEAQSDPKESQSPRLLTSPQSGCPSTSGSSSSEEFTRVTEVPGSPLMPTTFSTSEYILDWSSRIETVPPKEWKFRHPMASGSGAGLRHTGPQEAGPAPRAPPAVGTVPAAAGPAQWGPVSVRS